MKILEVYGNFMCDENTEERILVFTEKDKELDETLRLKDDDENYLPLNKLLKETFNLYDEDFMCYVELKDENDIDELKEVLKTQFDFTLKDIIK